MGTAVERLAAHKRRRLARNAEFEPRFAIEGDLAHEMAAIIGQEDRIIGRHMDAVRPGILPLAPGAQKIALAIEDHHRVLAAIEDVDAILAVNPDGRGLLASTDMTMEPQPSSCAATVVPREQSEGAALG
jgi:hypothetical protein